MTPPGALPLRTSRQLVRDHTEHPPAVPQSMTGTSPVLTATRRMLALGPGISANRPKLILPHA